jgi:hypothetical protein
MPRDVRPIGQDPHRTLGVPPGAGEAEIKRAYRALAKRYHPDAREGSAARFIEIRAAYEALLGTAAPGTVAGPGTSTSPGSPAASRAGRRPAQASGAGARTGAGSGGGAPAGSGWARRARGSAPRRPGAGSPGGAGPHDRHGAPGAGAEPSAGASRTSADGRSGHGRRRATLGSTSYDEAEEVFEPDWGGGAWYGASSGTYWTINPKEYADPRKHGPEYQARARRRAFDAGAAGREADEGRPAADVPPPRANDTAGAGAAGSPPASSASAPRQGRQAPSGGRATPGDLPPDWRAQAWTAAGTRGADRPTFEHEVPPPTSDAAGIGDSPSRPPRPHPPEPSPAGVAPAGPVAPSPGGPRIAARIVLAIAGWAVPGLATAAVAGIPGGFVATLPIQAAGVVLLALVPRLAWAAAGGGLAVVFSAIPIVAVVVALGGPVTPGEPMPVAVVLAALAWGGGLVAIGSGRVAPFPWQPGG